MMVAMPWNAVVLMVFTKSAIIARAYSAAGAPKFEVGSRTKADDWDADRYATNAGFVPELGKAVLDLLAPQSGERILDIGCGDGVLTAELQARGCRVVGVDFAPDMVAAAVKKDVEAYVMDASAIDASFLLSKIASHNKQSCQNPSKPTATNNQDSAASPRGGVLTPKSGDAGSPGLGLQGDGSSEDEPPAFDAVFTHAALHWIRTPRTVIEGAKQVLRPGGRFVGEFGGHGNIAAVRVAMHSALWRRGIDPLEVDPWYFPTPDEYRRQLEAAGFIVDDIVLVPRPTVLPQGTGIRGWLSMFTTSFLKALPEEVRNDGEGVDGNGLTKIQAAVVDEALAALQPALRDSEGTWTADYMRLRFTAHLPRDRARSTPVSGGGTATAAGAAATLGSGWREPTN